MTSFANNAGASKNAISNLSLYSVTLILLGLAAGILPFGNLFPKQKRINLQSFISGLISQFSRDFV